MQTFLFQFERLTQLELEESQAPICRRSEQGLVAESPDRTRDEGIQQ